MRYLALAIVSLALVGCDSFEKAFGDKRQSRWVRADVREASEAYETMEDDHLAHNYTKAYVASGRDMTCDDSALPAYTFECILFPHN